MPFQTLLNGVKDKKIFDKRFTSVCYRFVGLVPHEEEFIDETESICDLNLVYLADYYAVLLKLIQKNEIAEKDTLIYNINKLTNRKMNDYRNEEEEIIFLKHRASMLREKFVPKSIYERIEHFFPMRKSKKPDYFTQFVGKNNITEFKIEVFMNNIEPKTYEISINETVDGMLQSILRRQIYDDILKVCGYEEYLFGSDKLTDFEYVRDQIMLLEKPRFVVCRTGDVQFKEENEKSIFHEERTKIMEQVSREEPVSELSWNITQHFECAIDSFTSISDDNHRTPTKIQAGLYCGQNLIGKVCTIMYNHQHRNKNILKFDVSISKLPRMTKLCVSVEKKSDNGYVRSWANIMVFDFRGYLKLGKQISLSLWKSNSQIFELYPLGGTERNDDHDHIIVLKIFDMCESQYPIKYPSEETILQIMTDQPIHVENDNKYDNFLCKNKNKNGPENEFVESVIEGMDWTDQQKIAELTFLLNIVPTIPVDQAIKYLDKKYTNESIRNLVLRSLKCLS